MYFLVFYKEEEERKLSQNYKRNRKLIKNEKMFIGQWLEMLLYEVELIPLESMLLFHQVLDW